METVNISKKIISDAFIFLVTCAVVIGAIKALTGGEYIEPVSAQASSFEEQLLDEKKVTSEPREMLTQEPMNDNELSFDFEEYHLSSFIVCDQSIQQNHQFNKNTASESNDKLSTILFSLNPVFIQCA